MLNESFNSVKTNVKRFSELTGLSKSFNKIGMLDGTIVDDLIRENILERMKELGVNKAELARRIRKIPQHLSPYLKKGGIALRNLLPSIADALDIKIADLTKPTQPDFFPSHLHPLLHSPIFFLKYDIKLKINVDFVK